MGIKILQDIADLLRGKIFAIDSVVSKYECYLSAKGYKTLALGSSHIAEGYTPNFSAINMGTTSQDLYYSYNLYKLLNNENLKNVIVSFSVFSSGNSLIKSPNNKICVMYKVLYDIPYQDEKLARKNKFAFLEKYYTLIINRYRAKNPVPLNYRGEKLGKNYDVATMDDEIKVRALKHYKISQKPDSQMKYCIQLLEDTKQNSQNIYFVISPASSYYKEPLPSSEVIFKPLYELCRKYPHAKIINLYDSKEFADCDFYDGDHLNANGNKKFSDLINKEIE